MTHPARSSLVPALLAVLLAGPARAAEVRLQVSDSTAYVGVPFTVSLENRDDGVPHALELVQGHGVGRPPLARIDPIVGRATARLDVPPLAPGPYVFACSVHPNMIVAVKAEG